MSDSVILILSTVLSVFGALVASGLLASMIAVLVGAGRGK